MLYIRTSKNLFGLSGSAPFYAVGIKIKQKYFNKIKLEVDPEIPSTTISSKDFIVFSLVFPSLKDVTIKVRTEESKQQWIEVLNAEKPIELPEYKEYKDVIPQIIE